VIPRTCTICDQSTNSCSAASIGRLAPGHPLERFTRGGFHEECFERWELRTAYARAVFDHATATWAEAAPLLLRDHDLVAQVLIPERITGQGADVALERAAVVLRHVEAQYTVGEMLSRWSAFVASEPTPIANVLSRRDAARYATVMPRLRAALPDTDAVVRSVSYQVLAAAAKR
jgi:hypothetical protein